MGGFGLIELEVARGSAYLYMWLFGFYFTSSIPAVALVLPFNPLSAAGSSATSY